MSEEFGNADVGTREYAHNVAGGGVGAIPVVQIDKACQNMLAGEVEFR
jgi:hypothetical protein